MSRKHAGPGLKAASEALAAGDLCENVIQPAYTRLGINIAAQEVKRDLQCNPSRQEIQLDRSCNSSRQVGTI